MNTEDNCSEEYIPPLLTEHGTVEELTELLAIGASDGVLGSQL